MIPFHMYGIVGLRKESALEERKGEWLVTSAVAKRLGSLGISVS